MQENKSIKDNKESYTVITGASKGLGKSFAEVCAKKGHNLILISLPFEEKEYLVKHLIDTYNIKVIYYEVDLTNIKSLYKLVDYIKNYRVNILINNAGIGGTKKFTEASSQYIDDILLLNIRSLVVLTHQLLPLLKKQKESYILNISSLAAFSPMPFKTVYPASKAFVYSFSRGLNAELKNTNVHVAVANPGGMPTNKEISNRLKTYNGFIKWSVLSPEETAEICLRKLFLKKSLIIPGKLNQFSSILLRFVPLHLQFIIFNRKLQKELATCLPKS